MCVSSLCSSSFYLFFSSPLTHFQQHCIVASLLPLHTAWGCVSVVAPYGLIVDSFCFGQSPTACVLQPTIVWLYSRIVVTPGLGHLDTTTLLSPQYKSYLLWWHIKLDPIALLYPAGRPQHQQTLCCCIDREVVFSLYLFLLIGRNGACLFVHAVVPSSDRGGELPLVIILEIDDNSCCCHILWHCAWHWVWWANGDGAQSWIHQCPKIKSLGYSDKRHQPSLFGWIVHCRQGQGGLPEPEHVMLNDR